MKKGIGISISIEKFDLSSVKIIPDGDKSQYPKKTINWLNSPHGKGNIKATFDIARMDHYDGDITLPDQAFQSEDYRIFFQSLINRYRLHIARYITDTQRAEAQREICRLNNEKRKIDLEPLIPEIEQFIRQYRRANTGANIKEILNAVSEHLSAEKGISISVRTLRNKNIQALIRSIAEKEKSGKV